jgi:glycosyltransferase involved in cell wall biosynthesis
MRILLVHQNFPGQFLHLAPALVRRGHEVHALKIANGTVTPSLWRGVHVHPYAPTRGSSKGIHPWIADMETKTIRGEAAWRKARELRATGFSPDVIYAHPGWGESLFLKQVWPQARLVLLGEFFYSPEGADMGFDPEFASADAGADHCRTQMKNLNHLSQLVHADLVISPTRWQASRFPMPWRDRIEIAHEGVNTRRLRPDPQVRARLKNGTELSREDEVITFVARHLEPYPGFHVFMRALPALLRSRPKAQVLVVGEEGVSYGAKPSAHGSWKECLLEELGPALDEAGAARVHFLGRLDRESFTKILQLSTVHVYLTYPFVLSWSLIEAMSIGCAIVASDTAPVREVLSDGRDALLVDFFDGAGLVERVNELLEDAVLRARLVAQARCAAIERFDLESVCLPRQLAVLEGLGLNPRENAAGTHPA